nr:PREDICTED: uncharacterized protein LOC107079672 isoform X1 [Lepisosteus oculatus]
MLGFSGAQRSPDPERQKLYWCLRATEGATQSIRWGPPVRAQDLCERRGEAVRLCHSAAMVTGQGGLYLLLLTVSAGAQSILWVSQPPGPVMAAGGSSVSLNCSFGAESAAVQLRVEWRKRDRPGSGGSGCQNGTKLISALASSNQTSARDGAGRLVQRVEANWSSLTLTGVTASDSGHYVCVVVMEIPSLAWHCSNGTQVDLEMSDGQSNSSDTAISVINEDKNHGVTSPAGWRLWLLMSVGTIAAVLAVIAVCYCLLRWKQKHRNTGTRDNPIYENMTRSRPVPPPSTLEQKPPELQCTPKPQQRRLPPSSAACRPTPQSRSRSAVGV